MSSPDSRPLVADYIETLTPYQPGKPIEELQRELGLDRVIKLASNENAFGPSPMAVAAAARQLTELHRYPDGSGFYLKQKLAQHYQVSTEQLIIGNGSNEIIELAIRTFMAPGDHLLTSATTFVVYRLIAQAAGRGYREVPLAGYDYDLDALAAAIDSDTRMIFIANPNNPTGACFDAAALERFLARVPDEVIVVLDEAYAEFADPETFENGIAIVERRPRTIVLRTFSKAYGLPGLRIGFGISSPELVGYMNRVRQPFNVNSLAQVAAIAALDDHEHLERTLRGTREGRERLTAELTEMGLEVVPSQANFVLIDLGRDGVEVFQQLLRRGVIVRAMAGYGLRTHIRVTIGTPDENRLFLDKLREVLG